LQHADVVFLQKAGCVSCHNNSLTTMALEAARRSGIPVNEQIAKSQLSQVMAYLAANREKALQGSGLAGGFDAIGYILLGIADDYLCEPFQRFEEPERETVRQRLIQMGLLSERFNMDLSSYKMDAPFPMADILEGLEKDTRPNVGGDRRKHLANIKPEDTLRDYCQRMTRRTYSHVHCVGGPETIADFIGEWVGEGACDGFILLPWQFPLELEVFVDQVVPVLQKRGLFRRDYRGETLRDHFGLPFPQRR